MDYFNPIKNKYNYEQNQKTNSSRHKRSISSIQSSGNSNREINQSSNRKAKNIIQSFHSNNNNYQRNTMFNKEKDNIEDYQRLAKKFYSIIITLQDELTKQTIKNYSLLEENLNLKQQFSEIQKKMNPSN